MSLGRKTLLWLAAVLLGLAAAEFAVAAWVIDRSFADLEVTLARKDLERVRGALAQELDSLAQKTADWAIWDDTHRYVVDRNEAYARANLGTTSLVNLGVNLLLLVDADGREVTSRGVDLATATDRTMPKYVRSLPQREPALFRHVNADSKHFVVQCSETEAALLCIRPVHASDGQGESRGSLLLGYLVDERFRRRLAELTELPVELVVREGLGAEDTFDQSAHDVIVAKGSMSATSGNRALEYVVRAPRQIHARGRQAQSLIAVSLLVLCVTSLAVATWLIHVLVIGRLRLLRNTMARVGATGELPVRIPVEGHDELADVGHALDAMNARLRRTVYDLQKATRAKSVFLANVSHEVRTPLSAILGYADLMLDPTQTERERLDSAETIRRNGQHLLTIINQILDVAKIEAGQMHVESIATDVVTVLHDVVDLMRGVAVKRGLSLDLCVLEPIPRVIHSDPTRLKQILLNLIGNAIKFTERGGVRVGVRYHVTQKLTVTVSDTGIGIPADKLGELFQPFAQADQSHTRRFGGTGLGLSLARDLARMLGGDITVTSVVGEGSTFALEVATGDVAGPFVTSLDDGARDPVDAEITPRAGKREFAAVRVLLAEDAVDSQRLIATILRSKGARVTVASDGNQAVAAVRGAAAGEPFDLVLMDMQMPELDGYGATAQVRALGYHGPIVALTANAMAGDRDRCLAAGCNDYATKPLDARALVALVRRHARRDPALPPS